MKTTLKSDRRDPLDWIESKHVVSVRIYMKDLEKINEKLNGGKHGTRSRMIRDIVHNHLNK